MKKRILSAILCFALIAGVCMVGTVATESDDPSLTYVKQTAPHEDSELSMWFEHSFTKVMTSDTTPSGMDTYSVYMAKNEVENAQFVLYSDVDKSNLTATVTDFTNEAGDSVSAQLFYEMYTTTEGIDELAGYGFTAENTIVHEGEVPDPVVPLSAMGSLVKRGIFSLVGGKSQALFIKLRTTEDTPAGWYSAQLDIKDASKNIIKTATVYAYVWDFVISEETVLKSAFYIENDTTYGGSYKTFYDYLLDNRMVGMDPPGGMAVDNPYLTNPRVSAIRVSTGGCGSAMNPYYMEIPNHDYPALYDTLHSSDIWDVIEDKLYFYPVDEPIAQEVKDITGHFHGSADDVIEDSARLKNLWPDPKIVCPMHNNHPYPYYKYTTDTYSETSIIGNYPIYDRTDMMQAFIDNDSVTIWCPMIYAFTPRELYELSDTDTSYHNMNDEASGLYTYTQEDGSLMYAYAQYDWADIYGHMKDRMASDVAADTTGTHDFWAYCCMRENSYTYCNQLIENSGLQNKMLFWQLYQEDITGYLYYATNGWHVMDDQNGGYIDNTPTGTKTNTAWKTDKVWTQTGYIYGDGVLFYGPTQGKVMGVDVIGSLRTEIMRDGIEEYQMLSMLADMKGEAAAKAIVGKISNNIADYVSLPTFSTDAWDEDMNADDIMEATRRELGAAVEAATLEGACEHSWNEGEVTTEPGCLTIGKKTYTCTKCGIDRVEDLPTHHTVGDCFVSVSGEAATCTTDSTEILECTLCGYQKRSNEKAFHTDEEHYVYKSKNDNVHEISCDVCKAVFDSASHTLYTGYTNTCTEDGYKISYCRYCDYSVNVEAVAAKGHDMADGECSRCDYSENKKEYTVTVDGMVTAYEVGATVHVSKVFYVENLQGKRFSHWSGDIDVLEDLNSGVQSFTMPEKDVVLNSNYVTVGDANGDGSINAADLAQLKFITSGKLAYMNSLDIDNDGSITAVDMNLIKRMLLSAYIPVK